MNCNGILRMMHEYLDGDLHGVDEAVFRAHLSQCPQCATHLKELERTIALLRSLSHVRPQENFSEQLLAKLPKPSRRMVLVYWLKGHPFVAAVALFFLLTMGSSALSWYGGGQQLEILSEQTPSLVVEEGDVVVPEGREIEGDLVVRHGNVKVYGRVNGDVIAINGEVLLASTAHIAGETREINRLLEWMWYKVRHWFAVLN